MPCGSRNPPMLLTTAFFDKSTISTELFPRAATNKWRFSRSTAMWSIRPSTLGSGIEFTNRSGSPASVYSIPRPITTIGRIAAAAAQSRRLIIVKLPICIVNAQMRFGRIMADAAFAQYDVRIGNILSLYGSAVHRSVKAIDPPRFKTLTEYTLADFHYCFNTSTIRGQKLSLVEEIDIAAKAGYQAIEPWINEIEAYVHSGGSLPDLKKRIA